MSDAIIQAAIEARLKAWADAQTPPIPIAYENSGYKPTVGQRYLRCTLLPAKPLNPSQGGQHKHFHGIYQVDVHVPEGGGRSVHSPIVEALRVLFKRPTTMPRDGINVNVLQTPATGPGGPNGAGFWMVPLSIYYDANSFTSP